MRSISAIQQHRNSILIECSKSIRFAGMNAFSVWSDESRTVTGVSGKPTFGKIYYNDGSCSASEQKFTATLPGLYSFTMTARKES